MSQVTTINHHILVKKWKDSLSNTLRSDASTTVRFDMEHGYHRAECTLKSTFASFRRNLVTTNAIWVTATSTIGGSRGCIHILLLVVVSSGLWNINKDNCWYLISAGRNNTVVDNRRHCFRTCNRVERPTRHQIRIWNFWHWHGHGHGKSE